MNDGTPRATHAASSTERSNATLSAHAAANAASPSEIDFERSGSCGSRSEISGYSRAETFALESREECRMAQIEPATHGGHDLVGNAL